MLRLSSAILVLGAALGCALPANAHLMVANKGSVTIQGQNANIALSVPVATLTGFDDNGDRLIDLPELGRHANELAAQVSERLRISADGADPVEGITLLASAQTAEDAEAPIDYVVVMSIQRFAVPPRTVELWTDLFGATKKDQRIAFTASNGATEELTQLTPDHPRHQFFRGGWAVFTDFLQIGATHILLGYDHLLFLLTIIVAAMTTRQWVLVITAFTVAHALTLTAAVLQLVSVSPAIVEPMIAASIVALAVDNLLGGTQRPFQLRLAIVFACGLLHGLGFAASLIDFGLTRQSLASSLIGFNVGVELGQFVFVALAGAALWLIDRAPLKLARGRLVTAVSVCAAVPGLVMVVSRAFQIV